MTTTGYEFKKSDRSGKHKLGVCDSCRQDFGLEPFDNTHEKLTELSDKMFRHGTGDSLPCIGCGFDINNSLASRALKGKTDRELVVVPTEDRPNPPLPALAGFLNRSDMDVFADITLAPGEKPEETHHVSDKDGNPIAKSVGHPEDADETLRVMIDQYKGLDETYSVTEQKRRAEDIARLLTENGMNTEYAPIDPNDKSDGWYVIAANTE